MPLIDQIRAAKNYQHFDNVAVSKKNYTKLWHEMLDLMPEPERKDSEAGGEIDQMKLFGINILRNKDVPEHTILLLDKKLNILDILKVKA